MSWYIEDQQDIEAKKEQGIALCKRRIQAAIDLYGDGRISRQEYLRRVEQNEREIMAWRAKTSDREKLAMELSMCVQAIQTMTQMWSVATDEDKQGMARHLFESITYDLGTEQIVDFKLKPWAEQFFVLRAGLYADEPQFQGYGNPVAPTGLGIWFVPSPRKLPSLSLPLCNIPRSTKYRFAHGFNLKFTIFC